MQTKDYKNEMLLNEFYELENESNKILTHYFDEPEMTIQKLISNTFDTEFLNILQENCNQVCLRGSLAYKMPNDNSDIDIMVSVKSLEEIKSRLKSININYKEGNTTKDQKIMGRSDFIKIDGKLKNKTDIEVRIIKNKLEYEARVVHTLFLRRKFRTDRDLFERIKTLRTLAKNGDKNGYQKAAILVFEEQMLEDTGTIPNRRETSERGLDYPVWEGKINPIDWVYFREIHGVNKALEMVKEL